MRWPWDHLIFVMGIRMLVRLQLYIERATRFSKQDRSHSILLIDGLAQERHNSSALAMELSFSCTNPSINNTAVSDSWAICSHGISSLGIIQTYHGDVWASCGYYDWSKHVINLNGKIWKMTETLASVVLWFIIKVNGKQSSMCITWYANTGHKLYVISSIFTYHSKSCVTYFQNTIISSPPRNSSCLILYKWRHQTAQMPWYLWALWCNPDPPKTIIPAVSLLVEITW